MTEKNIKDIQSLKLECMERVFLLQDLIRDLFDEIVEFREVLFNIEYDGSHKSLPDMQTPLCNEKRKKVLEKEMETSLEMQELLIPVYKLKYLEDKQKS